jgi:oligoendopeptidase F
LTNFKENFTEIMKKIIVAFVFLIGVSSIANAQEIKKANIEQKEVKSTEVRQSDFNDIAKKEAHSLAKLLQLDEQMTRDLTGLFFYKYNQMSLAKNDNEKAQISAQIEAKLKATLTPSQMEKIASQKDLLHKLTH